MTERLDQVLFAEFLNQCGCVTGVDTEKLLKEELCMEDIAKEECVDKEIETPSFYMTDIMRRLSELETDVWDIKQDKVKMQNIIILLKSELIQIDKEQKDIITVDGLRYRRVFE
ncbi:MAG: hypothetical protein IKF11_04630 [Methanobrevibacter sp.]|nr:hypothetical protein [Methanobrevibacter sp.]